MDNSDPPLAPGQNEKNPETERCCVSIFSRAHHPTPSPSQNLTHLKRVFRRNCFTFIQSPHVTIRTILFLPPNRIINAATNHVITSKILPILCTQHWLCHRMPGEDTPKSEQAIARLPPPPRGRHCFRWTPKVICLCSFFLESDFLPPIAKRSSLGRRLLRWDFVRRPDCDAFGSPIVHRHGDPRKRCAIRDTQTQTVLS